jgi:hypothetical protein
VGIWPALLNHVLTEVGLYRAIETAAISAVPAMGSSAAAIVTLIAFASC